MPLDQGSVRFVAPRTTVSGFAHRPQDAQEHVRTLKHQTKRLLDRSVAAFAKSSQRLGYLFCRFTLALDQWVMRSQRLSAPGERFGQHADPSHPGIECF